MSKEQDKKKSAIVNELESIQALLNKSEYDGIPLLQDAISIEHEGSPNPSSTQAQVSSQAPKAPQENYANNKKSHSDTPSWVGKQRPTSMDSQHQAPSNDALQAAGQDANKQGLINHPGISGTNRDTPRREITAKAKNHTSTEASPKPQGENPFLPPHIRERLNTDKPLIDIITESYQAAFGTETISSQTKPESEPQPESEPVSEPEPSDPPQQEEINPSLLAHGETIKMLVDDVLKEYLPQIEETVRQRLLEKIQDGSLLAELEKGHSEAEPQEDT